jgi:beta-lactam-binding protein with PASTA domain
MIREAFAEIIQYKQIPPCGTAQSQSVIEPEVLGNFAGFSLVEATQILNNMGVEFQIVGNGTEITSHIPMAGQPVPRGVPIILYLDGDTAGNLTHVPNVEGLDEGRAIELINAAGLVPVVFGDGTEANEGDIWFVNRQSPSPGSHIPRGTQIQLRMRLRE